MRQCSVKLTIVVSWVAATWGLVTFGSISTAHAQAWVGDKGALDLSLDYNLGKSSGVVLDEARDVTGDGVADDAFPDGGTTTHQLTVGAEYVPVRRLAVNLSLPLVFLKYTGDKVMYPHPGGGTYDDGSTHATLTDLRLGARYQVLEEPVALSPHLGVSIPVADYETIGNTVAGRHLKALHLGLGIGRVFGLATYVHLLYEFSLVEKYDATDATKAIGQNRSDLAFTVGHKLLGQRLDLHADLNLRKAHGGVDFSTFVDGGLSADEAMFHDAILREDILLVGGGIGYQINNQLGVTLAGRIFVTGANTQNASVLALGVEYSPL